MTQQTILEEGAFQRTQRKQINDNFNELYGRAMIVRQSADVTATTNTTLADLTGLIQSVAIGTYVFNVNLQGLATANGGTKVAFNYASSAALTSIQCESKAFTAAAVAVTRFTSTTTQASVVAATVANIAIELSGTIVVSAAGTIQVQGAQNASHSDTTTYYAGSTFSLTKIA